jgi:hypothetical protein
MRRPELIPFYRTRTAMIAAATVLATSSISPAAPQKSVRKTAPGPAATPAPVVSAKPFAMRGVELGITLDAFRATPVIADDGETNLQTLCQGDTLPRFARFDDVRSDDRAAGITSCQWFGSQSGSLSTLYIDLGTGKGPPVFDFIDDAGIKRLFRIRVFANSQYAAGILDALTRNYGKPSVRTAPFQTLAGATFTQTRSTWNNGASSISLVEPCRQLQRYCLEYDHARLAKIYDALTEKRAATGAGQI